MKCSLHAQDRIVKCKEETELIANSAMGEGDDAGTTWLELPKFLFMEAIEEVGFS